MSSTPGNHRGRGRDGGFSGNYSSHRGRGHRGGGRDGVGGGSRGRGGSYSPRSGLHQANNQSFNRASSSRNSSPASSSSTLERKFDQLSLQQEKELIRFPSRPPPGTIGERIWLKTNHFQVEIDSFLKEIFHYNVTITPEVIFAKENRAIMRELVNLYEKSDLGNLLVPAYDGQKSFYTVDRLPFDSKEFRVTLGKEGRWKTKEYVITISLVAVIDLEKFRLFLNGEAVELPQTVIQALDVVLRQMPCSLYTMVKRSFVSTKFGANRLGDGLEAWRGFYQSLCPTQLGLTSNTDIMSAVFVEQLPVIDFVQQILRGRDISNVSLSDVERVKIKKALRGVKIEVTHRGNIRKTFTISGLTAKPTYEVTFQVGSGGCKHVVQYFMETYNLGLDYTALPCLIVGNKGDTYLPMEVCRILGGRYTKELNKRQTANLLKMNSLHPADREKEVMKIVSQNNYGEDQYCNKFGIKISESLSTVQARILPPPWLRYGDSGKEKVCQPRGGRWNMQNKKMFMGGTVNSWVCINFEQNVSDSLASRFCSKLAGVCIDYGLRFNRNLVLPPRAAHPEDVESALESLYGEAMRRLMPHNNTLDLLIVILPENIDSLYGEVKRICDTIFGISSQCFLAENVHSMKSSTLTMAAEKINIKAGGRNVVLEDALQRRIPRVSEKPTIILGADVTHPSPGNDSSPSIAAVVASLDWQLLGKYAPEISAQATRQERIEDMYSMCKAHFLSFHEENNQKPERIIIFRDGVSEGQISDVLQHELREIERAWRNTFNASISPPITFVMVQKRHHTRFFPVDYNNPKLADRSGNIIPGTVVDTGICHPSHRDFFLNSHAGIQGTNRPAHYNVLWDDNNFTEDQIQTLCYNLCYTCERCTRAVSYVTPTYYAHLLASRARSYLGVDSSLDGSAAAEHGEASSEQGARSAQAADRRVRQFPRFHDNLKNRMFYI